MDTERDEMRNAPGRDNRSADQIRHDIESTRSEMHETVEALERKLSPGQLVDEVWHRVRSSGSGSGTASAIGDVIRDHPVPLGLMGLGMAWLAVESATDSRVDADGAGTYDRADGRVGPYRGDAVAGELDTDDEGMVDRAKDAASGLSDKASDMKHKVSDRAEQAGDAMKDRARSAGSEAKHRAHSGADSVKRGARKAKRGFWSAMEEQPLGMAAVAFGLGVAGGLSAPTTDMEDRLMGDSSDAVKDQAKETAKDAASSAKKVAKDTARAARDEAERQDVVGDMKQSVERIAAEAKETAEERAHEEKLDTDGLRDRAEEAGDRSKGRME